MSAGGSGGKNDKTPHKIKGLVKRCRSFKENLLSSIARKSSLGGNKDQSSSKRSSPGLSPSPAPSSEGGDDVSLSHRIKEVYLTLSFMESLIHKNCIDLLGGSSNVMLDLIGSLLNDVKKNSASDSSSFQSAITGVKLVLSEFLLSIDLLVLKEIENDGQQALLFDKVSESLKGIREAITRLKTLIESIGQVQQQQHYQNGRGELAPKAGNYVNLASGSTPKTQDEKRPPLPPKLKNWHAKSFDMGLLRDKDKCSPSPPPFQLPPLLDKWLESTASTAASMSMSGYDSSSNHQCSSQQSINKSDNWTDSSIYIGGGGSSSVSSGGGPSLRGSRRDRERNKEINLKYTTSNSNNIKQRTYSDSCQQTRRDSSLLHLELPNTINSNIDGCGSSEFGSSATTHSNSLGSSLDNLLLVDNPNVNLSPNSAGGGINNNNRTSLSSSGGYNHDANGNSPSFKGLAELSNYDPDNDNVFGDNNSEIIRREVEDGQDNQSQEKEIDPAPPEIPKKTNRNFFLGPNLHQQVIRSPSPYDNVAQDEADALQWQTTNYFQHSANQNFMSYSESRNTLVGYSSGSGGGLIESNSNGAGIISEVDSSMKPPLPPKKRSSKITQYVELLQNFEAQSSSYHLHHSSHHHQLNHSHAHFHSLNNPTFHHSSQHQNLSSSISAPPAREFSSRASLQHFSQYSTSISSQNQRQNQTESPPPLHPPPNMLNNEDNHTPPALPPKKTRNFLLRHSISEDRPNFHNFLAQNQNQSTSTSTQKPFLAPKNSIQNQQQVSPSLSTNSNSNSQQNQNQNPNQRSISPVLGVQTNLPFVPQSPLKEELSPLSSLDLDEVVERDLFLLDSSQFLTMVTGENPQKLEGPEVKGGEPLVLMVYAASPDLKDLKFREVFLLTYRNFIRPTYIIELVWKRYKHFVKTSHNGDRLYVQHSRSTLDLFVDIIVSLTPMDLDMEMIEKLRNCIYHLVNNGEILSALKARKGILSKYEIRCKLLSPKPNLTSLAITSETQSLIQYSAQQIAQQMTLLDSELFRQLEAAELLLWAREQQEEYCPALNFFTDHFNKVSYWARSKVLLCGNSKERNKTMKKLIEVMRKLREYNNFNSLLAVLAALDSAPIRRLGFSSRLTEALKPHAALTDSSGSFRTYRQALSESKPPCIPYIGLVLQDLTFVHIGNADFLVDGKVNWIKRWQQYVVLEPIRRFRSCNYGYMRNDQLLGFLNNFDESLNDDDLWQLSEEIKPRGKN